MKERPILFNGQMVRAILEGRKTQTRRVIRPGIFGQESWNLMPSTGGKIGVHRSSKDGIVLSVASGGLSRAMQDRFLLCLYGQPGDVLWVQETFAKRYADAERDPVDSVIYRADGGCAIEPRWTPAIHMPRWASRLTLRIMDVHVQRVQEITEEDARHEGIYSEWDGTRSWFGKGPDDKSLTPHARLVFPELWDSINAKRGYSWESNPWVWAITFERHENAGRTG